VHGNELAESAATTALSSTNHVADNIFLEICVHLETFDESKSSLHDFV